MKKITEQKISNQYYFSTFIQENSEDASFLAPQLRQIHSNKIISYSSDNHNQEADGWFAKKEDLNTDSTLIIKTADCLPLYLESNDHIFFLHAGWKGLKGRIILKAFEMDSSIHTAFLGPCISQENYEVGLEFKNLFHTSSLNQKENGKYLFSVRDEAKSQLSTLVQNIKLFESPLCTFSHKELHSYRESQTKMRNFNIISLKSLTF